MLLKTKLPNDLPALTTPYTVKTSRGYHIWFEYPEEGEMKCSIRVEGHDVDIRGDGGYIVAPPSIHPDGGCYEFIV